MDDNSIRTQLFSIINEYSSVEVNDSNYKDLDLLDDCGYNSIDFIELICTIEDIFCIEIEEEYLVIENIRNIGRAIDYIKMKLEKQTSEVMFGE